MRLPWYIYVPLMLIAVGVTWYLRTKEMNFMPDMTEDEVIEEVIEEPSAIIGPPTPPKVDESALDAGTALLGLDHFSNYRENAIELKRVFTILKEKDNAELAYLAGERIMEHTQITKEEKRDYAVNMARLASAVQPYSFDANESRELPMEISGIPEGLLAPISSELSELVYVSSGGLISLATTFELGEPSLTLIINGAKSYTPLTESADLQEVISKLYLLIASEMSKENLEIPLWEKATADEFTVALTRVGWDRLIEEVASEEPTETIITEE